MASLRKGRRVRGWDVIKATGLFSGRPELFWQQLRPSHILERAMRRPVIWLGHAEWRIESEVKRGPPAAP